MSLQQTNAAPMRFDEWMKAVDALFVNLYMMTSADFEDWAWIDAYEDDFTPQEAFDAYCEEFDMLDDDEAEEDDWEDDEEFDDLFDEEDDDWDDDDF